jgi:hypothetical protein
MSPDQALLLDLLGRSPAAALHATPADIEGALRLATPNLRPYLHWQLESSGLIERLPSATVADLVAARRANILVHLQRRASFKRISTAFEERGLRVMVVKGMALAHLAYPEAALRSMSDIDLWANPADLPAADLALKAAGLDYPERTHVGLQLPTAEEALAERSYEVPGTPVLVELHGALKSYAVLSAQRLELIWRRSLVTELGGIPARVQHPEDLLLHLCLHAADQHRFSLGLSPLLDVHHAATRWHDAFDWPAMIADWSALGISAWMYLVLKLARDLLGAPLPDLFFRTMSAPSALEELEALAQEQIWQPGRHLPSALERWYGAPSRAGWLWHRLGAYTTREPGTPWWRQGGVMGRRLVHDLAVKAPRYFRGWMDGHLRGAELGERTSLARGRQRLGELIAAEERPKHWRRPPV